VLSGTKITADAAKSLSRASDQCWEALLARDPVRFGAAVRASFEAQVAMFPNMLPPDVQATIERYAKEALGYKITGSGGGGYLILVTDREIEKSLKVRIRRK
jgi:galactokinase/mevalonate kinase-like predicted kinase